METRNNGPVLFKTTPLVHGNWKQVPLATDGQDGNGLQLEKNRASFFFLEVFRQVEQEPL